MNLDRNFRSANFGGYMFVEQTGNYPRQHFLLARGQQYKTLSQRCNVIGMSPWAVMNMIGIEWLASCSRKHHLAERSSGAHNRLLRAATSEQPTAGENQTKRARADAAPSALKIFNAPCESA